VLSCRPFSYRRPTPPFAPKEKRGVPWIRSLRCVFADTSVEMRSSFLLSLVGASALRLGVPAGTVTLRAGVQPHMGLAVGDQFAAEALKSFGESTCEHSCSYVSF